MTSDICNSTRRTSIAAAVLLCTGCTSIVNAVQGAPLRSIYPGQESTSALSTERHSRIRVSTRTVLGAPSTTYSTTESFHGSYWKYTTRASTTRSTTLQNTYSQEDSFTGTSEIWKIETEFLQGPTPVAILVQGAGFHPAAVWYPESSERDVVRGGDGGLRLSDYSRKDHVVAGVAVLKPGQKCYLLVQHADSPVDASYRVAIHPIE
jgi:hypothetical protein